MFRCKIIFEGYAKGSVLFSKNPISLLGDINDDGVIVVGDLTGSKVAGKILVFPYGRGSTVGSYTLLKLKKKNLAPAAIINKKTEPIIAVGAAIAEIPLVEAGDDFFSVVKTGDIVTVDALKGYITIDEYR